MSEKNNFKMEGVLKVVIVVFLLCTVTTFTPMINANVTKEIIKEKNLSKFNNNTLISYELLYELTKNFQMKELLNILKNNIKNKGIISLLTKLDLNKYNKIIENFEFSNDFYDFYNELFDNEILLNRVALIKAVRNCISIYKDVYQLLNINIEFEDINQHHFEILNKYFFSKISINNYDDEEHMIYPDNIGLDNNSGFDKYWENYIDALGIWDTDPDIINKWPYMKLINALPLFNCDNYEDWYKQYHEIILGLLNVSAILVGLGGLILLFSPMDSIMLKTIGSLLIIGVLYFDLNLVIYINFAQELFSALVLREVEIFIRVVDENGTGISNLYIEPNYIKAKNTDALIKCDDTRGKQDKLFIYELGPADYVGEDGWYSLKKRDIAEYPDLPYKKAPCPPGNWSIDIYASGYERLPLINVSIPTRGTYVNNSITLMIKS